jgi:methionine synthase II (cobalamin-independent)
MVVQYSEGMPFVRIDEKRQTISVVRDHSDQLERFYESWTEGTRIAISSDYAMGLHAFLREARKRRFPFLKGHITGPMTFTLSLRDHSGRFIYFDEELREIALMTLKAKALWQIDVLRQCADRVLIFIDEPIFSAIGSTAYMGVSQGEIDRMMKEIVRVIKDTGSLACVHCCGKADWEAVIETGTDMLSFDSYDYFETFNLYAPKIREFLINGGYLVWGAVPTSDSLKEATYDGILDRLKRDIETLSLSIDQGLIISRSLLSPSCGLGSRTIKETLKAAQILMRLREDCIS